MKNLLCIILLASTLQCSAQSPGYQGKHFVFSYSPEPVLFNYLNLVGLGALTYVRIENFGVFVRHNFQAEYVITRKISLAAEYNYALHKPAIQTGNDPFRMTLQTSGIALDVIFYSGANNPVAPVGNYLKLKLILNNYTATGSPIDGKPMPSDVTANSPEKGQTWGAGIGFGHNHFVGNRILISFGANMDFNFSNDPETNPGIKPIASQHISACYLLPTLRFAVGGLFF